jgi:hypothetical protein
VRVLHDPEEDWIMPDRFGKNQKPLFVIRSPVRAKGYRSNFKLFETTRFLDPSKVARLRRHSLEVGTLEAAGHGATVVAEIRNGVVIGLTLRRCADCTPMRKRIDKRTVLAVREKMPNLRKSGRFKLPGLARTAAIDGSGSIIIPIWPWPPIVIIYEPPGADFRFASRSGQVRRSASGAPTSAAPASCDWSQS